MITTILAIVGAFTLIIFHLIMCMQASVTISEMLYCISNKSNPTNVYFPIYARVFVLLGLVGIGLMHIWVFIKESYDSFKDSGFLYWLKNGKMLNGEEDHTNKN